MTLILALLKRNEALGVFSDGMVSPVDAAAGKSNILKYQPLLEGTRRFCVGCAGYTFTARYIISKVVARASSSPPSSLKELQSMFEQEMSDDTLLENIELSKKKWGADIDLLSSFLLVDQDNLAAVVLEVDVDNDDELTSWSTEEDKVVLIGNDKPAREFLYKHAEEGWDTWQDMLRIGAKAVKKVMDVDTGTGGDLRLDLVTTEQVQVAVSAGLPAVLNTIRSETGLSFNMETATSWEGVLSTEKLVWETHLA